MGLHENKIIKNAITVAASILLIGCIKILITACTPNALAEGFKIVSIMRNERETDSTIQYSGIADKAIYGKGKQSLHDDLFEYVYDPYGYIITTVRAHDKASDNYSATSDNQEELETRALSLHLRNLAQWLKGDTSITKKINPMGTIMYEMTETLNGNPTGRKTCVIFSKGGALISLTSVNKPVPEADLAKKDAISEERAAEIVFADLMKLHGDVLKEKEFSKVHWTVKKEAIQMGLVWTVTIDQLTRTDFPIPIQGKWGVQYRVDVFTGEIVERAEFG